jgi:hypothetical protein
MPDAVRIRQTAPTDRASSSGIAWRRRLAEPIADFRRRVLADAVQRGLQSVLFFASQIAAR